MDHQKSNQGLNRRIAIVGAGAAGLSAGHALKTLGYKRVVVFERANRVGGKCCTVEIEGRNYELGAGIVSEDNRVVLGLAKEFGVPLSRVPFGHSMHVNSETGAPMPKRTARQTIRLLGELAVYYVLSWRYASAGKPGLARTNKSLMVPFAEFARVHQIENLAMELALFFTGFGYDYFERIPAVYVLKYYRRAMLMAFLKRKIYRLPGGIQHLWTAVASSLDVRLNTEITKIERADLVRITTPQGTEEFDELILTSPLDEALQYLDATAEERTLFSKIEYVNYCTVACSVKGFPDGDGYVPGNFSPEHAGKPVFWHHRHADADVYTVYSLAEFKQTDEDLIREASNLISKMGGSLKTVYSVSRWKYFPHVSSDEFRAGYFQKVEALQGARHTYYAGEMVNFSTVGLTSEYAHALVGRFFA